MTMKSRSLRPEDVDKIAEANEVRQSYFFRDPDRPDSVVVKNRGRVPPEVKRAQTRLRTARWRAELDRRKAPTLHDIGMSMAVALATTSWANRISKLDYELWERTKLDLQARGFSVGEAKRALRKLRIKMLDPADREGEESESCGPPIWNPGGEADLPF
jgi:hypothetical protein